MNSVMMDYLMAIEPVVPVIILLCHRQETRIPGNLHLLVILTISFFMLPAIKFIEWI